VLALLALALGPAPALAQGEAAACVTTEAGADVVVGVRDAPPFLIDDPIRGRRGLAMDLWASIERELETAGALGEVAFVECPLGAQLQALADGRLDLVISPLTVTAERMALFDFTHPYLSSGLTVAQRASATIDFGRATEILWETVSQPGVPRAILFFLALNFVLAAVLARLLRDHDDYEAIAAEPAPVRLYRYSMEAVVRTIGLYGLGDTFRSTTAKTLEVAMAVIGAVLSASIFGVLTAAFIGSSGGGGQPRPAGAARGDPRSVHLPAVPRAAEPGGLCRRGRAVPGGRRSGAIGCARGRPAGTARGARPCRGA
jgi:hypothetical protein